MKSKTDEMSQRVLLAIKLDATGVYSRLKEREKEYVSIYAAKRTRDHFEEVLKNKYDTVTITDLSYLSVDVIEQVNRFYTVLDNMRWYLFHTEEMPNALEEKVEAYLRKLKVALDTLVLYIDAEMGADDPEELNNG